MDENFSNEPLPLDGLPRLGHEHFVAVDPRYLRVSLAGLGIAALVVVTAAVLIATQAEQPAIPLAIAGGVVVVLVLSAVLRTVEVRRLAYQLREHDLSLQSGVITHSIESVPFSRIQHVSVSRGPIERSLGLATLQVNSAGPNLAIPGLATTDAERIKALVTARADIATEHGDDDLAAPVEG